MEREGHLMDELLKRTNGIFIKKCLGGNERD
jgi:hypothetical protein